MAPAVTRRRFLTATAGALAAPALASGQKGGQTMALDAVQLYCFSQLAGEEGKSMDETRPQAFATIAEAGFAAVEDNLSLVATDESATGLADMLKANHLKLAGLYSGGALHTDGASAAVNGIVALADRAKELGCPGLSVNPDPIGREKTNAELATQAAALDDLGAALAERRMFLGIHTHSPEMSHNAREFRYNLDHTDPAKVGLCADFHWIYRGGADPYAITERYAGRIVTTHLRNSLQAVWCECFCRGDLDYGRIEESLLAVRYRGPLVIEIALEPRTPRTRGPLENLRASREYLAQCLGRVWSGKSYTRDYNP